MKLFKIAEGKSNKLKSSPISIHFYLSGDQKFAYKLPALLASTEDIAAIRHPCNSLQYPSNSFSTLVAYIDGGVQLEVVSSLLAPCAWRLTKYIRTIPCQESFCHLMDQVRIICGCTQEKILHVTCSLQQRKFCNHRGMYIFFKCIDTEQISISSFEHLITS